MRVLRVYPAANDPRHRERERALLKAGVEVGLVLPDAYGSDWSTAPVEPEIRHWRSPLAFKGSIPLHVWSTSVLRRAIREFQPDVIDIHEEPFFVGGIQAVLAAGRIPTVMYSAQNLEKRLPPPFPQAMRWVFGRVRGFYPCSLGAAQLLRRRGFRGRVEVVPIGVDEALFDVRPTGSRVGFIGRLVPEKGVRDLLSFGHRLLCLGDGPLAGEVRAAGGEVRRVAGIAQLAAGLQEMSVLVAPSLTTPTWKEQFGRMVVEAMAAGVPVVAYDTGSLPEVVGAAGLVVPEGDVARLKEAVKVAESDGSMAERGRAWARSRYRWDVIAGQMKDLYAAAAR